MLGAATGSPRTADETEMAVFWADGAGTETPPGHWSRIAAEAAEARGLSLCETARLLALVNIASADAGIVAWDAKYAYDLWRPITAIREADTDGNPGTVADPSWTPLLPSPPFPEYVSGHSTFSGAATQVLARFLGDATSFTTTSDGLPGVTRSFTSFSQAADEGGMSRLCGGIHFTSANVDGLAAGRAVGDYVVDEYLRPVPEPAGLALLGVGALLALCTLRRARAGRRGRR